ncbi:sorcin-like [Corticium candelabrum]|uniref:sorcin-like n=1 Tax=Corticium candelabrum TaxID=121492 RepID=UPI002E25D8E4|nr:sorcin-like [Corticium candelabrum]
MAYPGYGAPGGYPGAPPAGYGQPAGYPVPGGYPGGAPQADPLFGYFSAVAGVDGQIDARELQRCLTQSGISGTYQPFSLETCRIMIAMLDRDYSGKMGFSEFKELWTALSRWQQSFATYDRDRSGTVEPHELQAALTSFGYNMTPQALGVILRRFSSDGRVGFDDFVACLIKLRSLTTQFQQRDFQRNGTASFRYDEFIQVAMSL